MSTIFGKCNRQRPVTPVDMQLMKDAMNHWNADSVHTWNNQEVAFGHLMLYNTPESLYEQQPLYDPVSGIVVVADARIDNREELYNLLKLNSQEERKLPDSSILLLLFKKYRNECVHYLVGDFAFAIWDERERQLFCARDHMGVRPFFYVHHDNFFAFASEKKGLLCLPEVDKSINKQYYYNILFFPEIQAADTTLYQAIKRLPPAHTLSWNAGNGALRLQRFWTLDAEKELRLQRTDDYYDGLRAHMEAAVKCRLRSYYPVGAELSGGLDSSVITGIASQTLQQKNTNIYTFSYGLTADDATARPDIPHEHKFIDSVIAFNHITDGIFVTGSAWDSPIAEADFMLSVNDGPEIRATGLMATLKHAAMQHGVRSLLSGFPGDEMVTYRGQYSFLDHLDQRNYLQYFLHRKEQRFNKLKPLMPERISFLIHKLRNMLTLTDRETLQACRLLGIPIKELYRMGDIAWTDEAYLERHKSHRHYQKYRLLKSSTTVRLEGETCMGIPLRVDSRFPMADIRLTQFYLSMPDQLKSGSDLKRNTYRAAMAQYLPDEVRQRKDKYSHMAPFRALADYKDARAAALETTIKQMNNGTNKYDVLLRVKRNKHSHITVRLDFLRWFIENRALIAENI